MTRRHHRHHRHHHRFDDYVTNTAGMERFSSDKRQLGGLMLVLSICATFQPMANIAALAGPNNTTPSGGLDFYSLFGSIIGVIIGIMGVFVGYQALIMDQGGRFLTALAVVVTQLAWLPFLSDIIRTIDGAAKDPDENTFIPMGYEPRALDVAFVGACGVFGVLVYGTGFLGSLAFTQFALLAFHSSEPQLRNGQYYRGRAAFYNTLIMAAGLSQTMLGAYVWLAFGRALSDDYGGIAVAMYVISFPEVACLVGFVQMTVGAFGFIRTLGVLDEGIDDHRYQVMIAVQWIFMVVLQILVQVSYAGVRAQFAAAAPSIALLSFGLNALPAYLDYKMRTVPDQIPNDFYDVRQKVSIVDST